MEFQLADLFEALCDAEPEADVLVAGERRYTRGALDERANRLAHHLDREGVARGDRVGVYSCNRGEWVEALFACWKLGAAAININYRYVTDELRYLWENADLRALVYERRFARHVRALGADFPQLTSYVVLEDDADHPHAPGAPYEEALAAAPSERGFATRSADDRHVLYTGGTTGLPKGVVWRHEDLYRNLAWPLARIDRPEDIAQRINTALEHIAPEQLIVSSDCGFGRAGCNRDIAFFKSTAIAQGTNLVRKELGLETTYIPAANPALQTDIVPTTAT